MKGIYFQEMEMMSFLTNRGWTVTEENIDLQNHFHGSKFLNESSKRWIAKKNEEVLELEIAFTRELKKKLLAI